MFGVSQMKTVKGVGVGEEAVIGELLRYRRGIHSLSASRAKIALIEAQECDFDLMFEMSQEFLGFVCVGEYDREIAEIAEELRLVGIFLEDENGLSEAVNEKAILLPKKSRALLAPDIEALKSFEKIAFAKEKEIFQDTLDDSAKEKVKRFFMGKKKLSNKKKKYF